MRSLLIFSMAALSCLPGIGQRVIDVDNNPGYASAQEVPSGLLGGTIFPNVKYVRFIEGSPFFSDEWMRGVLVMSPGKVYTSLQLKLNLLDNEVHYEDADGQDM